MQANPMYSREVYLKFGGGAIERIMLGCRNLIPPFTEHTSPDKPGWYCQTLAEPFSTFLDMLTIEHKTRLIQVDDPWPVGFWVRLLYRHHWLAHPTWMPEDR